MALQVYTASLLKEGLVAYLCLEQNNAYWSTDLNKASAVEEGALDILKTAAERSERDNIVVAPYAIAVHLTDAGIVPDTKREQIRASGPTIIFAQGPSSEAQSHGLHAA